MSAPFSSYEQFWPYFMEHHGHPWTRRLHVVATAIGGFCGLVAFPLTLNAAWLLAAPVFSYPVAWFSHFAFERNRPAAWTHPYWSLLGDIDMLVMMLCGTLDADLERRKSDPGTAFTPFRRRCHHVTEIAILGGAALVVLLGLAGRLTLKTPRDIQFYSIL